MMGVVVGGVKMTRVGGLEEVVLCGFGKLKKILLKGTEIEKALRDQYQ